MADAYLNLAEAILSLERKPMRPREIIQHAYSAELAPWHLYGPRQDKTLHARLSEDIARNPEGSRFFRTAPGVFFLTEFRASTQTPDAFKQLYLAPPRRKELRRDRVFSIRISELEPDRSEVDIGMLKSILDAGKYAYLPYGDVRDDRNFAIIQSFVVVHRVKEILSFRCGKFFPSSDPIYGRRSVGIGSAVIASDLDLLYDSFHGVIENGIGELGYGVGLPRRFAEKARYENEVRPYTAVLIEDEHRAPSTLHVVMGYRCPDEFEPSKTALSVNDLRWIDASNPGNFLDDYDVTSRILFERQSILGMLQAGST